MALRSIFIILDVHICFVAYSTHYYSTGIFKDVSMRINDIDVSYMHVRKSFYNLMAFYTCIINTD